MGSPVSAHRSAPPELESEGDLLPHSGHQTPEGIGSCTTTGAAAAAGRAAAAAAAAQGGGSGAFVSGAARPAGAEKCEVAALLSLWKGATVLAWVWESAFSSLFVPCF